LNDIKTIYPDDNKNPIQGHLLFFIASDASDGAPFFINSRIRYIG